MYIFQFLTQKEIDGILTFSKDQNKKFVQIFKKRRIYNLIILKQS